MFFLLINWILTGIFIAFPGKRQFQIASFMGFAIICSLISIEFSLLFSTMIKKLQVLICVQLLMLISATKTMFIILAKFPDSEF